MGIHTYLYINIGVCVGAGKHIKQMYIYIYIYVYVYVCIYRHIHIHAYIQTGVYVRDDEDCHEFGYLKQHMISRYQQVSCVGGMYSTFFELLGKYGIVYASMKHALINCGKSDTLYTCMSFFYMSMS
jgi:hypothetical protein